MELLEEVPLCNTSRIEHLYRDELIPDMKNKRKSQVHYGDVADSANIISIIQKVQPDGIYNLVAQSHVSEDFVIATGEMPPVRKAFD